MRLCPICGKSAEIARVDTHEYEWRHRCDNDIEIESGIFYSNKESAVIGWDAYCNLLDTYGEAMAND